MGQVLAHVGRQVRVDLSGMAFPGVQFGAKVTIEGVITGIDVPRGLLTVKLIAVIGGVQSVTVPVSRVTAS